jgi:hypothetical protein
MRLITLAKALNRVSKLLHRAGKHGEHPPAKAPYSNAALPLCSAAGSREPEFLARISREHRPSLTGGLPVLEKQSANLGDGK